MSSDDCLICLAPVAEGNRLTVRCPNRHGIHLQCMMTMITRMGKDKCPYCFQKVDFTCVIGVRPSRMRRLLIRLEHRVYDFLLVFLVLFSARRRRGPWGLNRAVVALRVEYEHSGAHVEGLAALRGWAVRTLKCMAAGCVVSFFEFFMRQWLGQLMDVITVTSYTAVLLMYGCYDAEML